jgi:hypothetical protein
LANAVVARLASVSSGRFAASRVLRQRVAGTIPRWRILHPDVVYRCGQRRLLKAADRYVDFRGASSTAVSERRTTLPAECAVHARGGLELARCRSVPGQVGAPDRQPADGMGAGRAPARLTVTQGRRIEEWSAAVVDRFAKTSAAQRLFHACKFPRCLMSLTIIGPSKRIEELSRCVKQPPWSW